MTEMLNPAQIALGRSRAYSLFSKLALCGLTQETLPAILAIPELVESSDFQLRGSDWQDEAAAAHHRIFGLGVFPYQSLFLSAERVLGGVETRRVLASYARAGFICSDTDAADHLGWQLACLSFLCGAEAGALNDSQTAEALRVGRLQREFLAEHLLRWLPPLVSAFRRQEDRFYAAFGELLLSLVADHMEPGGAAQQSEAGWRLDGTNLMLEDEKTGLQEIADWLTTPVNCGFFLSRAEIGRLARLSDLPGGFGERRQVLGDLLRAGAHFDRFSVLCAGLRNVIASHRITYNAWADEFPLLSPWMMGWGERILVSAGLVEQLGAIGVDAAQV